MKVTRPLTIAILFLTSLSCHASGILKSLPVSAGEIVKFQYQGHTANTSSKLPDNLYGEYKLCKEGLNFPEYASTFAINKDGSGYYENWGRSKPRETFKWGVLVESGATAVTEYTGRKGSKHPAYVVVYKWDDGDYAYTFLYEHDGKAVFPGPYGSKMRKNAC